MGVEERDDQTLIKGAGDDAWIALVLADVT